MISQAFGTEGHYTSPKIWPLDTPGLHSEPRSLFLSCISTTALAISRGHDTIAVAGVRNQLWLYPLGERLDKPIRVLSIPAGHIVTHIAFSRDENVLIAGTGDTWAVIWDLSLGGGKPVAAFDTGHKESSADNTRPDLDLLDISSDHSLLLTGSSHWSLEGRFADPTLRIWPLEHLIPKRTPWIIDQSGTELNKVVVQGFFDETSRFVVGVTGSGVTNVWDLAKAHFDAELETHPPFAQTKATTFAEGSTRSSDRGLLVLGQGKSVSISRLADIVRGGTLDVRKLSGFDSNVQFVKLSSSAKLLVAGGIGGTARLWDLTHVDPVAPSSALAPNPYSGVKAIQLSPTGRTAITLRGHSLEFWNIEKPSEPRRLYATEIDAEKWADCIVCHIVISSDDHWISLQSTAAGVSRIIEIGAEGPRRREFTVAARTWRLTEEIYFSPDSRWLFVEEADRVRAVYDLRSTSIQMHVFSDSASYTPVFSPDGKWVCSRRYVNEYHDPIGRDKIVGFVAPTDAITDNDKRLPIKGFATGIGSLNFSPDGRWVALSGDRAFPDRERDDRYVQVLHLDDAGWTKHADLTPIEYAAETLRFSADGRWLFTGSSDIVLGDRNVSARVWDLSSPAISRSGQVLSNVVWNLKLVQFSPDSKWLITVSGGDQYARLWALNGEKLEFVTKLTGPLPHLNNYWAALFSPDSSSVVLWTTDDATPFYWRLDGNSISELGDVIPNGDREIKDVHFSANGRLLTILNSGGTTTGTSGTEGAHFTFVDLTAFPEEDSYATIPASKGAYSHIYREDLRLTLAAGESIVAAPTDLQDQLQQAAVIAGRNLSWDEWVKAGISIRYRPTFPSILVGADVIAAENANLVNLVADHRTAEADQMRHNLILWTQGLNDAESCNDVAWELAKQRDLLDALQLSSCALSLAPNDPNYHDTRGLALALSGRREEAIAEFDYFIDRAWGIDQFARTIALRRKWIATLRSGGNPFADGIQ